MTDLPSLIAAFTTLFVIIDPVGLAPLFLAMTQGMSPAQRRRIGFRACGVAAVLLLTFAFTGEALLEFVGISMPAFRIAGPGAIAAIILLTGQAESALGVGAVLLVMFLVLGLVLVLFLASTLLERILGKTGINVVTRLLGMLLAALAIQFILDGLRGSGFCV